MLIIWLLELNSPHNEGDVRVDVGVRVLAGMLLCHCLDLLQDGLFNFRGVDIRLECRDVAGYNSAELGARCRYLPVESKWMHSNLSWHQCPLRRRLSAVATTREWDMLVSHT